MITADASSSANKHSNALKNPYEESSREETVISEENAEKEAVDDLHLYSVKVIRYKHVDKDVIDTFSYLGQDVPQEKVVHFNNSRYAGLFRPCNKFHLCK